MSNTSMELIGGAPSALSAMLEDIEKLGFDYETYGSGAIVFPRNPANHEQRRQAAIARVPKHIQMGRTFLTSRQREEFACICAWLLICDHARSGWLSDPAEEMVYCLCWRAVWAFYRDDESHSKFAPDDPRRGIPGSPKRIEEAFLALSVLTLAGKGLHRNANGLVRCFSPVLAAYVREIIPPRRRDSSASICSGQIDALYKFIACAKEIEEERHARKSR